MQCSILDWVLSQRKMFHFSFAIKDVIRTMGTFWIRSIDEIMVLYPRYLPDFDNSAGLCKKKLLLYTHTHIPPTHTPHPPTPTPAYLYVERELRGRMIKQCGKVPEWRVCRNSCYSSFNASESLKLFQNEKLKSDWVSLGRARCWAGELSGQKSTLRRGMWARTQGGKITTASN